MNNLNQVFSKYVLLASTFFAMIALIFVEINVDHISYKYIEGSTKPKINFNILDSKLFSTKTYTNLFSESTEQVDSNKSSQTQINKGLDNLINGSNINTVLSKVVSDDNDTNNNSDSNSSLSNNLATPIDTHSKAKIAQLYEKIASLEKNSTQLSKFIKDHK